MKKLLVIVAIMAIGVSSAFAQRLQSDTINIIEKTLNLKGVILKKEYGGVIRRKTGTTKLPGSCSYETLIITNMESGKKTGGLVITAYYSYVLANSSKTDEFIAYLDPDELMACVLFLKKMSDEYLTTTPDKYTEIEYRTPGKFRLACYYDIKDKNPAWRVLFQAKDYTYRSLVEIDKDDISVLIQDFESAYKSIKTAIGE